MNPEYLDWLFSEPMNLAETIWDRIFMDLPSGFPRGFACQIPAQLTPPGGLNH